MRDVVERMDRTMRAAAARLRKQGPPPGWRLNPDPGPNLDGDPITYPTDPIWIGPGDTRFDLWLERDHVSEHPDHPALVAAFELEVPAWIELAHSLEPSRGQEFFHMSELAEDSFFLWHVVGDTTSDELSEQAQAFFETWRADVDAASVRADQQVWTPPPRCEHRTYQRGGAPHLMGLARGYLVPATPEERVRQETVRWLVNEVGVPLSLITCELPVATKKDRGRADIVVFSDDEERAMLVVECKAPTIDLTDDTLRQAERYARVLRPTFLVLTNGNDLRVLRRRGQRYESIHALPRWSSMGTPGLALLACEPPPERLPWDEIHTARGARAALDEEFETIVGKGSPDYLVPFAVDLSSILMDVRQSPSLPTTVGDYAMVEDLGLTERSFGNVSGGSWYSPNYRAFRLEHLTSGETMIVSLVVLAGLSTTNHPRLGNRRGYTYLIVAVDDDKRSHNALQLRLDTVAERVEFERGRIELRGHSQLSNGRGGSASRDTVREYVASRSTLASTGDVSFGKLRVDRALAWESLTPVLARIVEYALLRDELRDQLWGGRTPRGSRSAPRR